MSSISGIVAPVLTPFDDGALAVDRIADSVSYTVECGCDALVAAGTGVQETVSLTIDERTTLIQRTVDEAPAGVPVMAGISHPALAIVDELIDVAEAANADVLVAFPPWNFPPTQDEIADYYRHISNVSNTPILMYDNPVVTTEIEAATMVEIAGFDGIEYVKETLRAIDKISKLIEGIQHDGRADVFTTMDALLPTLLMGGSGAIVPPPASRISSAVHEAFMDGDLETAVRHQRRFGTFPPVDQRLTTVLKGMAEADGVRVGGPRPPYTSLSAAEQQSVVDWFDS